VTDGLAGAGPELLIPEALAPPGPASPYIIIIATMSEVHRGMADRNCLLRLVIFREIVSFIVFLPPLVMSAHESAVILPGLPLIVVFSAYPV